MNLHPADLSPQKETFALVLDLWANKRTGLVLGEDGTRAALVDGEPKDAEHLGRLMGLIYSDGSTEFKNADTPLRRPKLVLGAHLLKAAARVAKPDRVRSATGAMLVPGPNATLLTRLPLSDAVREVVSAEARVPLEQTLKRDGDLAEDIAVLLVLKVVRLAKPTERERLPVSERNARVDASRTALLLRRLEREWATVKDADDYTTLGISPDTPANEIGPAAERMRARYAEIAEDLTAHPKARSLAQNIYQKVLAASKRVADGIGRGAPTAEDLPDEKTAFAEGQKHLDSGDYSRAVKWFALARKYSSNDAANVGYLGWAVYNDPERPKSKRRAKGRELLELSDFINPHEEGAQVFLARVEHTEGDVDRARGRLERLLASEPNYLPAQKLLAQIRRG